MLYLVPEVSDLQTVRGVCRALYGLGVQAAYMPPLTSVVRAIYPLRCAIKKQGNIFRSELCFELLERNQGPDLTENSLRQYGLTMNNFNGHRPQPNETNQEYNLRVTAWFTDFFEPRLHESPLPTAIVAPYEVCMIIAAHLTNHQRNRAINPQIPTGLRAPGAILEYTNSGFHLEATAFRN